MNFNFQAMDADPQGQQNPNFQPQSSSSSSTYTYFTEQAIRGIPSGNFGGGHGGPEMFGGRLEMREAIQRELEKDRIREEILAGEMARRRILEAEVRHELMMEREMAMRSGGGGFPSPFMPPPNHLEPRIFDRQPIGLEERIIMSLEERYARDGHPREIRGLDAAPFHRFPDSPKFKGIHTHLPEGTKKKVIVLEKWNSEALAGAKRKPPPVVAGETCSKKKKITEEWSCAICEVSATNERGLTEHLKGKKHQVKEAALIAQKSGANFGLGVEPKSTTIVKPLKLCVTAVKVSSSTSEKKPKNKKQSKNKASSTVESNDKKEDGIKKKKEKFTFWCEMCKVGAFSEKVMNNHKEGKKHLARLVELLQKGKPEIIFENEGETSTEVVKSETGKEAVIEEEEEEEDEGDNM